MEKSVSRKNTGYLLISAALAFAVPSVVTVAAQAQGAAPELQLTEEVRQAAEQARLAISQNNFPSATALLNQATSQARTDGDRYVIATMRLDIANRTFNAAGKNAAINALISSPLVDEGRRAELYLANSALAYNAQDVDAARSALQGAIDRGATDPRTYIALASIDFEKGNRDNALTLVDRALALQQQSSQPISDHWYRRAIHMANRAGDVTRVAQMSQALVAAYPTAQNWRDVLTFHRTVGQPDQAAALDLWRLQGATDALYGEADYLGYLRLANEAGYRAEVERVVLAGKAVNMLDGGNSEIATLDRGTTRFAESLRSAMAGRASAAANQADGTAAMAVADDYVSLGRYAEAAAQYRIALQKGGIDADLVNERLGMALALSGDVAGARTALDAVTGPRSWIARYWRIFADTRSSIPAATSVASGSES